jgi:hypothetical protein
MPDEGVWDNAGENPRFSNQRPLPTITVANGRSVQVGYTGSLLRAVYSSTTTLVTITVKAHQLRIGSDSVAYSGGTITVNETGAKYYVYCLDPNLTGGAVTYLAVRDTSFESVYNNEGIYYVGTITTPTPSGGDTGGGGGGGGGGSGPQPPL